MITAPAIKPTKESTTASNMIPPGVYHARPLAETWVELVQANRDDASAQCAITVQITDEGPYKNREYTWFGSFAEGQAAEITMRTLGELGIAFDAATGAPTLDKLADDVRVGIVHREQKKYVEGELTVETNPDGSPKMIPQINYIAKGSAMARAVTDDAQIAAHREKMRGTFAAAGRTVAGPTKTAEGLPLGADGKPVF